METWKIDNLIRSIDPFGTFNALRIVQQELRHRRVRSELPPWPPANVLFVVSNVMHHTGGRWIFRTIQLGGHHK